MSYRLTVTISDSDSLDFALQDGQFLLGSHHDCEFCVEFGEIADRAARIEVRGEAVFLQNLNPFPIYVGEHELNANEQTEWPVSQAVLLTKSVSLAIHDEGQYDKRNDADIAAKKTRSTVQMAIVFLCIAFGCFLLTSDNRPSQQSTEALNFSFTDLVERWEATAAQSSDEKRSHRTVLNYLIDARVCDIRWGVDNPSRAISTYELLLDSPMIEGSSGKSDSPEGRIHTYALARINDLTAGLSRVE